MMTIAEARSKVVLIARGEVGNREGANNWNKYASDPLISRLYGWTPQNQPWCATFVNWCFLTAFGWDIGSKITYGGSAACSNAAQNYKNHGAFYKSPMVGDQSFYFSGGGINHTGIVVDIGDTYYTAVEGNYSDKVSLVRHRLNGSDTAGFGRPSWDLIANISQNEHYSSPETPKTDENPKNNVQSEDHFWKPKMLRYGSTGVDVMVAQSLLLAHGFDCGEVDGEFGVKTSAALNRFQRWAFPKDADQWDGICGNKTWAKLLERGDAV